MYELLKFKPAELTKRTAGMRATLQANSRAMGGPVDFLHHGLGIISRRLERDPRRYLDYGPYWWALKDLMRSNGYPLGDIGDALLASHYCGATCEETLVAADAYREIYLATFILGNRHFDLSVGEPAYVLFDQNMELGTP